VKISKDVCHSGERKPGERKVVSFWKGCLLKEEALRGEIAVSEGGEREIGRKGGSRRKKRRLKRGIQHQSLSPAEGYALFGGY